MDESEANSSNICIKHGGCANMPLLLQMKLRYEMSGRTTTKDLTSCPTA